MVDYRKALAAGMAAARDAICAHADKLARLESVTSRRR